MTAFFLGALRNAPLCLGPTVDLKDWQEEEDWWQLYVIELGWI